MDGLVLRPKGCGYVKMYLLSDNTDTRTGLRLVGVDGAVVHTREELKDEVEKIIRDKEIAVVLISEKLSKQFPDTILELKLIRHLPLVVEIPDRHGSGRSPDFISEYIREAIGVKL